MKIAKAIPLFGVVLVGYMVLMSFFFYSDPNVDPMKHILFTVILPSRRTWSPDLGDAVIVAGLLILFIELIKSTSSSSSAIAEHILSTFVFIFYIIAFLLAPMVANSTFLILGIMSMIDVIAGFTISISGAKRDISLG
ncbi:MAG: hypothetical protein KDH97_19160 [Calditrichaeota bacterium]|nr:hypothetical protein [Calditrichota bacterium]MCB0292382.1 hypothetical protein [Calditrichota bacterium]MCB9088937.1 hypothetical protein [Calditrichia bacterium]